MEDLFRGVTDTVGSAGATATPWFVGIVGTALGGIATYLAARLKANGGVGHTEAGTLWAELRAELVATRAERDGLRQDLEEARTKIDRLEGQLHRRPSTGRNRL